MMESLLMFLLLFVIHFAAVDGGSEACETCTCFWRSNKKYIDCSNLGLTEIPSGINTWVHNLALQGNDIEELGDAVTLGSLQLEGLEHLNLANNPIVNVTSGFFDKAPNLKSLMLHHTEISTLPSNIFDSLTSLKWLWLNNNALTSLSVNTFKSLDTLYELYLFGNELETIPDGMFSSQKAIRHIHLQGMSLGATVPTCCQMCGLPDGVDVKWGDVEFNKEMNCGCGGSYCTTDASGICNDPVGSTLTCANYKFSAAGRSFTFSFLMSVASIAAASSFALFM